MQPRFAIRKLLGTYPYRSRIQRPFRGSADWSEGSNGFISSDRAYCHTIQPGASRLLAVRLANLKSAAISRPGAAE
jgi:hypothetical protein